MTGLQAAASLAALLVVAQPARAEVQAWTGLEARVPVAERGSLIPTSARFVTETRFGGPADGLALLLLRVGPMWELNENVVLNLNAVQATASRGQGDFAPESRIEAEPNVRGRLGVMAMNLRTRIEHRWLRDLTAWRVRVQLRTNLQPDGFRVFPFVATEAFFDVSRGALQELRHQTGISWQLTSHLRLDTSYMLRPRRAETRLELDHIGSLTLTFSPKIAPVIESGGG